MKPVRLPWCHLNSSSVTDPGHFRHSRGTTCFRETAAPLRLGQKDFIASLRLSLQVHSINSVLNDSEDSAWFLPNLIEHMLFFFFLTQKLLFLLVTQHISGGWHRGADSDPARSQGDPMQQACLVASQPQGGEQRYHAGLF